MEPSTWTPRKRRDDEGLPLFAPEPATNPGEKQHTPAPEHLTNPAEKHEDLRRRERSSRETAEARHLRDLERLDELARELLEDAGDGGATISDLRHRGEQRGFFTGDEGAVNERYLSYLGQLMKRHGIPHPDPARRYRASTIAKSNRRKQTVWVTRPPSGERSGSDRNRQAAPARCHESRIWTTRASGPIVPAQPEAAQESSAKHLVVERQHRRPPRTT